MKSSTDLVPILNVGRKRSIQHQDNTSVVTNLIKFDLLQREPENMDHDYSDTPNVIQLGCYVENSVTYIAGYVARNLSKRLDCEMCKAALVGNEDSQRHFLLLTTKDRGGLVKPSASTITICNEAERCFRRVQSEKPPNCRGFAEALTMAVMQETMSERAAVFADLHDHMFDTEPENNHVVQLVKHVAREYVKIRLYHWGKEYTAMFTGNKIRKQLSKLILFKHQ
jgi:hypothetical protein